VNADTWIAVHAFVVLCLTLVIFVVGSGIMERMEQLIEVLKKDDVHMR
jgi:hypothetical protein